MGVVVEGSHHDKGLEDYRYKAMKAAKDLCYGEIVVNKLAEAKTEGAIERIMIAARERKWRDD